MKGTEHVLIQIAICQTKYRKCSQTHQMIVQQQSSGSLGRVSCDGLQENLTQRKVGVVANENVIEEENILQ